jgi:hypothetical protein
LAYFLCLSTQSHALEVVGQNPINLYVTKSKITFNYFGSDGFSKSAELDTVNYIDPVKYLLWVKTLSNQTLKDFMLLRVGKTGSYDSSSWRYAFPSVGIDLCSSGGYPRTQVECVDMSASPDGWYIDYKSFERNTPLFGVQPTNWNTNYQINDFDGLFVGAYGTEAYQTLDSYVYFNGIYNFPKTDEHPSDIWLSQITTGYIGGYVATQALLSTLPFVNTLDFDPLNPPDIFIPIDLGVVPCSDSSNENCIRDMNRQILCTETGNCIFHSGGSGDTGSGDTGSGDTGSGDTGSGDTGSGDTGSGDTGSGDTGSGDTGSGGTGSGGTGSGDMATGDSSIFENFAAIPSTEIDISAGFGGNGWISAECPQPATFTIYGQTFGIPYDSVCSVSETLSYLIVAAASLSGLGIVMRGFA